MNYHNCPQQGGIKITKAQHENYKTWI